MTDLKLIDELLCDLKWCMSKPWREVEHSSSVAEAAMARLRQAHATGEMPVITLSLARYFEVTHA